MAEPATAVAAAGSDILEAHDIAVSFEGLAALDGVTLALSNAEILGLIGPNGVGKATFVNVLTGFQNPDRGRVLLDSIDVTG